MRVRCRRSLDREVTAAACTSGVCEALRAFVKSFERGFWRGLGAGLEGLVGDEEEGVWLGGDSEVGVVRTEGCVLRMSERMWITVVWRAAWPLVKQWMKRVRFSSARVWRGVLAGLCDRGEWAYFVKETAETETD